MTDPGASPNAFEQDKPGTADRTRSETLIEGVRQRGGVFVQAVRASTVAMILTDPTLPGEPIVFANQSFLDLSGYAMEEVLGQRAYFLNGLDTDPDDARKFREILAEDRDGVVETVQYAKDGRRFTASVLLSAFKDEAGKTIHHFLTFADVTRRVTAENEARDLPSARVALERSEARLRAELRGTELLRALSERLVPEENPATFYEELLSAAIEIARSDGGTVQLYDPEARELVLYVTRGFPDAITEHFHRVDANSRTACGIALRTGERTFIDFDDATDEACRMHVDAGYRSAQATPILSRAGEPLGMLNTHWREPGHRPSERELRFLDLLTRQAADLIEHRRTQATLRASEERLRRFGEASHDVLWIRDAETMQWTYLTPAFETIYGLPRTEAMKGENFSNWLAMVMPEDRAHAQACIDKVRAGEHVTFDYRIRRSDGEIRWLRNTDFPIADATGKVALFGGIGHDITSLKRSETALRESEERLRLIVENAVDYAIFTTDPQGWVVDWREGAAAVFGYSQHEMAGEDADVLFTPEDRASGVPSQERATAAEHGKAPDVRWHMRKDGSRVFIDGVSTGLRNDEGELIGFLKIGQDVTERHAAEGRQNLLLAELQHRVRNTLGMIRSMVRFTAHEHDDIDDYLSHLTGRLDSLSRTQQLLTRSTEARVDLHELVSDELTAQAGGRSGYVVEGPRVWLSPKAAEVVSLALHELVTNSVKYGALGNIRGAGNVSVRWHVAEREGHDWLKLRWREPAQCDSASARQGFGTELITQRVPYELRGEATLEIGEQEVAANIAFPLSDGPSSLLETGAPRMVTA